MHALEIVFQAIVAICAFWLVMGIPIFIIVKGCKLESWGQPTRRRKR